jgi:hypothetical protein
MDPDTGLVALGATADLAKQILGATADYVGQGLQTWTDKRVENVTNIFKNAEQKLGDAINGEGTVPPRVLGLILDQGSYASDPVSTAYFGGILASSRSGVSRDDRGAVMAALVGRLSAYELRSHYIFYSVAHKLLQGRDIYFSIGVSRDRFRILLPLMEYFRAMDFQDGEDHELLIAHTLNGLAKEGLTDAFFASGDAYGLSQLGVPNSPGPGVAFQPSALGVELFLWAHGLPQVYVNDFLKVGKEFERSLPIRIPEHASIVGELPEISDELKAAWAQFELMVQKAIREGHQFPPYPRGEQPASPDQLEDDQGDAPPAS